MKQIAPYLDKVDALSPRERVILFALLLAGLWAVMDALLLSPLDRARQAEQAKLQAAASQIAGAQEALTRQATQIDPAQVAEQRRTNAYQALTARMQAAERSQSRLVAAKDMIQVLENLLRNQPGLRLAQLETLAPEPVGLPARAKPEEAALFRQGVRLTLVGGYENLVRYMESLERLPLGFYWSRAELDAGNHPDLELTLTLYTLSTEKTWLTV